MEKTSSSEYPDIGDHALIADGRSGALVSRAGSIDWCCLPHFDSPAVFCRILDWKKGGFMALTPRGDGYVASRRYAVNTNVLITSWKGLLGEATVTDFMPSNGNWNDNDPSICRLVSGVSGEVDFDLEIAPTFGYASAPTELSQQGDRCVVARGAGQTLFCEASVSLRIEGNRIVGGFKVAPGEEHFVTLAEHDRALGMTSGRVRSIGDITAAHWREWVDSLHYEGPYREMVIRSAIVLKSLVHEPTGAVVAALTTSLPERVGGDINWDYRYVWLRDAALILDVLQRLNRHEESVRFFDWLHGIGSMNRLQPVYSVFANADVSEHEMTWLEGYKGSRPVRVGNAAAQQLQLDAPGHLLDAICVCYEKMQRDVEPEFWHFLSQVTERVIRSWHQPDHSVWETRQGRKQFLYSKIFAWVALDRAITMAERHNLEANLERWKAEREKIRTYILEFGYNPRIEAFSAVIGEDEVDPSALIIPLVHFLPADDPRMKDTVARIRKDMERDGMLLRNQRLSTGGPEAAFLSCTFWLVDYLALTGEVDEAKHIFERIIGMTNDVGLLAEEVIPSTGEQMGNFPQGFSHLELIRSAMRIADAEKKRQGSGT